MPVDPTRRHLKPREDSASLKAMAGSFTSQSSGLIGSDSDHVTTSSNQNVNDSTTRTSQNKGTPELTNQKSGSKFETETAKSPTPSKVAEFKGTSDSDAVEKNTIAVDVHQGNLTDGNKTPKQTESEKNSEDTSGNSENQVVLHEEENLSSLGNNSPDSENNLADSSASEAEKNIPDIEKTLQMEVKKMTL